MYLVQAKTHSFKIISLGMCFALIFSSIFPTSAFASRSDAGGGELAEFDVGSFALSVGLSLGSMAIGSAINAGVSSLGNVGWVDTGISCIPSPASPGFFSAMGDSFAKSFNVANMATNYSTFVATSQVGRAVGAAGQYYDWNPSTTFWLSNIASAATGGFLNPSVILGDAIPTSVSLDTAPMQSVYYTSLPAMAKGALVGAITGFASGAAVVAIDGSRMNDTNLPSDQRQPGIGAQIAGMVAGVAGGNFSRALVNPATWDTKFGGTFEAKKGVDVRIQEDIPLHPAVADYLINGRGEYDANETTGNLKVIGGPDDTKVVLELDNRGNAVGSRIYDQDDKLILVRQGEYIFKPTDRIPGGGMIREDIHGNMIGLGRSDTEGRIPFYKLANAIPVIPGDSVSHQPGMNVSSVGGVATEDIGNGVSVYPLRVMPPIVGIPLEATSDVNQPAHPVTNNGTSTQIYEIAGYQRDITTFDGRRVVLKLDKEGYAVGSRIYDQDNKLILVRQGEHIFRPTDKIPGAWVQENAIGKPVNIIGKPEGLDTKLNFFKVSGADVSSGNIDLEVMPLEEIYKLRTSPNVSITRIGNTDYFNWVEKNVKVDSSTVANRLLEATFIKTADMWPRLAGRALATIAAKQANSELAPFVRSTVEGLANPLLISLAEHYDLKPGLYVGEKHMANSIEHINSMRQAAYQVPLNKVSGEARAVFEKYKGILANIPDKESREYKDNIEEYEYTIDKYRKDTIDQYHKELEKVFTDNGFDIKLSTLTDPQSILKYSFETMEKSGMEKQEINDRMDKLEKAPKQDLAASILGAAMGRVSLALQVRMKDDIAQGLPTEKVLEAAGTDRFSLFWNSATKEMKSGLSEGVVSGATSYVISKLSKDDPLAAAAGAYAAAMLTGAIRGVIWYNNWERSRQNGELIWMDRYSLFKPEPYKGDDWFQRKVSEDTSPRELKRFNDFGQYSGLKLEPRTKNEYQLLADGKFDKKPVQVPGYELEFKNQKPDLTMAVLASLAQTNREFLNRAFAFGAPQAKPESINTLTMSDYLGQLNVYAMSNNPNWLSSGLIGSPYTSGLLSAGSSGISNNILTSLAAVKPIAGALGMQRQRFVLTNSPLSPFTIQSREYKPWAVSAETRFHIPFPSDVLRARSRTGQSYTKEQ